MSRCRYNGNTKLLIYEVGLICCVDDLLGRLISDNASIHGANKALITVFDKVKAKANARVKAKAKAQVKAKARAKAMLIKLVPIFDILGRSDLQFVKAATEAFKEAIKEDKNAGEGFPYNTPNRYYFWHIYGCMEFINVPESELFTAYEQMLHTFVLKH